jgi:methionyl-tRNA formyltransferase
MRAFVSRRGADPCFSGFRASAIFGNSNPVLASLKSIYTMASPLRLVFMGTAELACASLDALCHASDFLVAAVVTQPDRPAGRDLKLQPSPVKKTALAAGIPVLQPEKARHLEFIEQLRSIGPDLIVVAAYGQILPPAILALPRFGCVNVHTSLLPKYRGAAPIQWALLNGDAQTGVTIMKVAPSLDTGDILSQKTTLIEPSDNAQTLHDRLARIGAELLLPTLRDFVEGRMTPRPQDESQATHVRKIAREDGLLDWNRPATALWNQLRAFTPWPGVFTHIKTPPKPRILKIWEARVEAGTGNPGTILSADKSGIVVACGQDALRILNLQREGGRRMSSGEFLAGHAFQPGDTLGT